MFNTSFFSFNFLNYKLPYHSVGSNHPYRGAWRVDDATGNVSGNPANAAQVQDLLKSLKHKLSAGGPRQTHSAAMTIDHMLRVYEHISTTLSDQPALRTVKDKAVHMEGLYYLAFSVLCWTVWTQ